MAISTTINPAAGLTANKVPYALSGGRLGDSGITFDPAANGNITLLPNGTGSVNTFGTRLAVRISADSGATSRGVQIIPGSTTANNTIRGWGAGGASALLVLAGASTGDGLDRAALRLSTSDNGYISAVPHGTGAFLVGTSTDSLNGRVQLASHSAYTGGYAFGTVADGTETLFRSAAGTIRTLGTLRAATVQMDSSLVVNGVTRVNTTQPDWTAAAPGIRTFDPGSATLSDVCTCFSRLVNDLIDIGILQ